MSRLLDEELTSVAIVRARTGLGDLLCTVPALRALRGRLPRAHVALVTFAEMRPVVERLAPWVDELLPFPGHPDIPERPPRHDAIDGFYAAVRARRFDAALQMYGANPAANEVTERLGARRTGGFFVPGTCSPDLRTHLPYPHHRHEVHRHLDLMRLLGAGPRGEHLEFPVTRADEQAAAAVRRAHGLRSPYALVHPGATSASRRWPASRFAEVGDGLARRGLRVAVTGVAAEAALATAVAARMNRSPANLAGETALGTIAALVRDAALVVSNDTGIAHLAIALNAPTVTVFLSGDPVRWAALDRRRHRVLRTQVECNPCPHLTCPIDHRCALAVPPRAVIAAADELLATIPPPGPGTG